MQRTNHVNGKLLAQITTLAFLQWHGKRSTAVHMEQLREKIITLSLGMKEITETL